MAVDSRGFDEGYGGPGVETDATLRPAPVIPRQARGHGNTGGRPQQQVPAQARPGSRQAVDQELRQRPRPTRSRRARSREAAAARPRDLGGFLKKHGLAFEFAMSLTGGLVAGLAGRAHGVVVVAALSLWAIANFHRGRMLTSPLIRQLQGVLHSAMLPLAAVAAVVGFFGSDVDAVAPVFAAVLAASALSVGMRLVRWRLRVPVRAVLVGDRLAIAQAAAQWARTPDISLVGALLVEPDLDDSDVPREMLGAPIAHGINDAAARVAEWHADVVLVSHGPGLAPVEFRRLAWSLEETGVSMGVIGILDAVAPHRITPGQLDGATVMDVRAPRPSRWVRAVKSALDRVAAALMLLVFSPVLLVAMAAVVLDTDGPPLFAQTRIGRKGREFKVLKIRTMVAHAEAVKEELLADNEYDGVLFKMKEDPRITRVGRLLRKTSIDELPQLINVLRGDMSLVGPRPHLPAEIAAMDSDTLRRLAVRPGITGLWQVSGRSDLPSGMGSELDTYYADNWTLTGDMAIALRTVKAVVSAKGAY